MRHGRCDAHVPHTPKPNSHHHDHVPMHIPTAQHHTFQMHSCPRTMSHNYAAQCTAHKEHMWDPCFEHVQSLVFRSCSCTRVQHLVTFMSCEVWKWSLWDAAGLQTWHRDAVIGACHLDVSHSPFPECRGVWRSVSHSPALDVVGSKVLLKTRPTHSIIEKCH